MTPLKERLFQITSLCEKSRTFRAVRRGFILMIPFVIISSFAHILIYLPIPAYQALLKNTAHPEFLAALQLFHGAANNYFSFFLTIAIAWSFTREWHFSTYHAVFLPVLSLMSFLIIIGINTPNYNIDFIKKSGVFSSLIATILAARLYIFFFQKFHTDNYGVTLAYRKMNIWLHNVIYAAIPMLLTLFVLVILQTGFFSWTHGYCLQQLFAEKTQTFFMLFHKMPLLSDVIFTIATQILWFFGVHGQNLFFDINIGYYGNLLLQNIVAVQTDRPPMYIINFAFNKAYLFIGGSGSILGLILAIFAFSRSSKNRTLAKIAFLPAIFNISEIIVFGIPLVLNPVLLFPFLLVPLCNLLLAYAATALHWVPVITQDFSWITPPFFSGYLATQSMRGVYLQAVLLIVDTLLYAPFVKMNDQQDRQAFKTLVHGLEDTCQHLESLNKPLYLADLPDHEQNIAVFLINELAKDLAKKKLFLVYQPQFNLKGEMLSAEALLRWKHSVAGFIYPPLIIALAKEGHFLAELENFIFQEACQSLSVIHQEQNKDFYISINLTGDSLKYPELEQTLQAAMQTKNILPQHLYIEITEQDALAGTAETVDKLYRLKKNGHCLLIDDFGMGHTSVTYLKTNIFDIVKLDASITKTVLDNKNSQQIIASLVQLSNSLNLKVVAEFVDNIPQRDKLADLGCQFFQGYLYSRPIPLPELLVLIEHRKRT